MLSLDLLDDIHRCFIIEEGVKGILGPIGNVGPKVTDSSIVIRMNMSCMDSIRVSMVILDYPVWLVHAVWSVLLEKKDIEAVEEAGK